MPAVTAPWFGDGWILVLQRSSASIQLRDSGRLERAISARLLGMKSLAARSCFSLFSRALRCLLANLALTGLYTSPLRGQCISVAASGGLCLCWAAVLSVQLWGQLYLWFLSSGSEGGVCAWWYGPVVVASKQEVAVCVRSQETVSVRRSSAQWAGWGPAHSNAVKECCRILKQSRSSFSLDCWQWASCPLGVWLLLLMLTLCVVSPRSAAPVGPCSPCPSWAGLSIRIPPLFSSFYDPPSDPPDLFSCQNPL